MKAPHRQTKGFQRAAECLLIALANNEWEEKRDMPVRHYERKWGIRPGRLLYWRANRGRIGDL